MQACTHTSTGVSVCLLCGEAAVEGEAACLAIAGDSAVGAAAHAVPEVAVVHDQREVVGSGSCRVRAGHAGVRNLAHDARLHQDIAVLGEQRACMPCTHSERGTARQYGGGT